MGFKGFGGCAAQNLCCSEMSVGCFAAIAFLAKF